ncbi:DDB1- and CUL4-associated factor 4 isoform X2 [Nematostella vectensis]|uniref:DDB1- and CUL4-associated factor 4 isoform X2 n=1 Tax=Nematostella vectensis TaxID=45351 RepID=UPI0020771979|nr:DDB1- and CUL4-associated factor 4 isoform X2 [Nematostella vectensis]
MMTNNRGRSDGAISRVRHGRGGQRASRGRGDGARGGSQRTKYVYTVPVYGSYCMMCRCPLSNDELEASSSNDKFPQIPGFYFDQEKNRYFRITPENPEPNPKSKNESKLSHCMKCEQASQQKRIKWPSSLAKYIMSRPEAPTTPNIMNSDLYDRLICCAKIQCTLSLDPVPFNHVVNDYAVCSIQADVKRQRILTLYAASPTGYEVTQFHDLQMEGRDKLTLKQNMSMAKNQKISAMLWSPHQQTKNLYILSLLGYGNMSGLVSRFPVNGHSVWSSDWNRNPLYDNIISIGGSRLALTIDVNRKVRVIRIRSDSDIFAQQFAPRTPILFNGSRDGLVRTSDIRLKEPKTPVLCFSHGKGAPITCIRVLNDDNYVISSAMDGSLMRWDLRVSRPVLAYLGHNNEITHGLPFHVDPTDSLLFGAGQDSVTRIWSVRSGELLRSIPFPSDTSRELSAIPALCYADEWGGPGGRPGLMYGTNRTIQFYSL